MLISKILFVSYLGLTASTGFIMPAITGTHSTQLAARVGIIDSHIDFDGPLGDKAFKNEECHLELDSQDLVCEISHGRNFHNQANQTTPAFINEQSADVVKYIELQEKKKKNGFLNIFDKSWMLEKQYDKDFVDQMMLYRKNAHGTHVAGIAAKNNDHIELIQMSIIPFKSEPEQIPDLSASEEKIPSPLSGQQMASIESYLENHLEAVSKQYDAIATYSKFFDIKVINGSYGIPGFRNTILVKCLKNGVMPLETQLNYLEHKYTKKFNDVIKEKLEQSPDSLYIFAAGNSSEDIDKSPSMPASIKSDQMITVASVSKKQTLSSFSCWGKKSVDIAAYGENIRSTSPGNIEINMSGTSQAAPQVTNTASVLKDMKADLTPSEIKYILMNTVDHTLELREKVKSGGILSKVRAMKAVSLIKDGHSILEACEQAYQDLPERYIS